MATFTIKKPNDKQLIFLKAKNRFVGYGGARGGGKSEAVRIKAPLLALRYDKSKILILRRTYPELYRNHVLPLIATLKNIAKYHQTNKAFVFSNGSRIEMGYCANDADVLQYQGQEYDFIFMDEATHFSEFMFSTLTACIRGANSIPKRMYITCNPGGIGHSWVKRLFIDREYKNSENPSDYLFIPATVYDNVALMLNDPDYIRMLENLPDNLREAWLHGNWDVFEGQYFREWDRSVHVCEPFDIPTHWRIYTSLDYGEDMLAHYIYAVDENSNVYVINEIYQPDLIVSAAASVILGRTNGLRIDRRIAPPDLNQTQSISGKTTLGLFNEYGLYTTVCSNKRVDGWLALKELLKVYVDKEGKRNAKLKIFASCPNLIRTLPLLQYDTKKIGDASNQPHELTHAPDALRYFASSYTYKADKAKVYSPYDDILRQDDSVYDKYYEDY